MEETEYASGSGKEKAVMYLALNTFKVL